MGSLQRFKLNIASSVVTQQNAGLGSMNTGEVLDLFKVSSEPEGLKPAKPSAGPMSASKVLEGYVFAPSSAMHADAQSGRSTRRRRVRRAVSFQFHEQGLDVSSYFMWHRMYDVLCW